MKRCKFLIWVAPYIQADREKFFIGVNFFQILKYLMDTSL